MGETYSKDEIYTATEVVRNFSSILKKVINKEQERAVIVKNNRFEAVLLHIDEYERLKEALRILEKIYKSSSHKGIG